MAAPSTDRVLAFEVSTGPAVSYCSAGHRDRQPAFSSQRSLPSLSMRHWSMTALGCSLSVHSTEQQVEAAQLWQYKANVLQPLLRIFSWAVAETGAQWRRGADARLQLLIPAQLSRGEVVHISLSGIGHSTSCNSGRDGSPVRNFYSGYLWDLV